jgi:hypothetical protein
MIEIRPPTAPELADIYARGSEHLVGVVDGKPAAYIGFRPLEGRLWGIFGVLGEMDAKAKRQLFYAFRAHLRTKTTPVYVLATDKAAERLLRLLGLAPTHETYVGKDVWAWTPARSI